MKTNHRFASVRSVCALAALVPALSALTGSIEADASSAQTYEIAFASFGPINAELFLADAEGNNAQPFLPHAGFDGNASFSPDGK
ncbi:MAG TPA: hypothetical protein VGA56_06690 [Opitutaceae bacterium]